MIAFGQRPAAGGPGSGCHMVHADREGLEQVREAFRQLRIPVGLVVTSRQCLTREAAATAFGLAVTTDDLERPLAIDRLPVHLGAPVPSGENRVLMTEADILRDAGGPGIADLTAGEAVVVAPQADGGFRIVARVAPDRWHILASGKAHRRAGAA